MFARGAEGAPVLYGNGGRGVVNLGAGTPENYDGPFAITYDADRRILQVRAGYLSRNGEFIGVPAPRQGLCACAVHWRTPNGRPRR